MATIKIFSPKGIRVIECFDTLDNVPYLPVEEEINDMEEENINPEE